MAARPTRLVITLVVVVAILAAGAFAVSWLWDTASKHFTPRVCTAAGQELDPDQASVAAQMIAAVTTYRRELPERAGILVLAAALQESKLSNIPAGEGDRDSVGVLQQRPSQDWGKVEGGPNSIADRTRRLQDVGIATTEFLDKLVQVDNWERLPAADAIQAVQISADGSLYAQHEALARAYADALSGRRAAAISCEFEKPTEVASARTVARQAGDQLDLRTPTVADARTVRVPGARWQTAAWFVANADRLGIDQVAYAGRRWSRSDGWTKSPASGAAVVATLATR